MQFTNGDVDTERHNSRDCARNQEKRKTRSNIAARQTLDENENSEGPTAIATDDRIQ